MTCAMAIRRIPRSMALAAQHFAGSFPDWALDVRSTTLAPPIARRLGALTPVVYPMLVALPPLRSHLIGRLRCPS